MILSQFLAAAAPASAHGGGESVANLSDSDTVARAVALAAAVLIAGVALIRPLAGPLTDTGRALVATAAAAGGLGVMLGVTGSLDPARYYGLAPLLLLGAGAAALAPVLFAVPAGVALVIWLCWGALSDSPGAGALMVGHVGVAAIWTGSILASASAAPGGRGVLVRRFGPLAVAAGILAAVTGVLSARSYDVTLHGITITDYGTTVMLKSALLVGVGTLGLSARFFLRRRARSEDTADAGAAPRTGGILARAELGVALAAVVTGAVLTSLPPPGQPPGAGAPLVRALTIDDAITGLVIAPQLPGLNLVHLMTDRFTDVIVEGRTYRAEPRAGAQGMWAEVQLPAGRSLLKLRQGREVIQQIVNTGTGPEQSRLSGADGAECSAAALGAVLGGSPAPLRQCPSDFLSTADANALRALITSLDVRGVRKLRLLTDTSSRGRLAEQVVRQVARGRAIKVRAIDPGLPSTGKPEAVLAVAGWEVARAGLIALGRRSAPLYGTYLAPWLVQSTIVATTGGSPLAPLGFDPGGPAAIEYLSALRRIAPQESGTTAGLNAYFAARGRVLVARDILLFAATSGFEIMPMASGPNDPGHSMGEAVSLRWIAGGSLTPISVRLPNPSEVPLSLPPVFSTPVTPTPTPTATAPTASTVTPTPTASGTRSPKPSPTRSPKPSATPSPG